VPPAASASPSPAPESPRPVAPRLWRDREFRNLWIGQSASQLAEQAGSVVLPLIAVLTLHVDAGGLGLLRAVGQAPLLLLTLPAGVWVDRNDTRGVTMLADACRCVILGAVAAIGLFGVLDVPMLLGASFGLGALSVLFDVSYQACLVRRVDRDLLMQATSALEGSRSAAQSAGPALGGTLMSVFRAPAGAGLCAVSFAVSFVSLRRMSRHEPLPANPSAHHAPRQRAIGRQIRQGLRLVLADSRLRTICLASAAFQFSFAALMTVYLLFLPRELHASGAVVGLALAATGPGAVLGSLLAARLPGRFGHGAVLVSAAALGDGVFLCLPALHGPSAATIAALLAVNFVFGVCSQLVDVTLMAVRQTIAAHGMQGRAAATITFAGMGLTPLGSLLGGYLGQHWGLRAALLAAAVGALLSPVLIALSPLARLGRQINER
jgi:MFS family permease